MRKNGRWLAVSLYGVNLHRINALAEFFMGNKTSYKNLSCTSVFILVFISHKNSALAFILYINNFKFGIKRINFPGHWGLLHPKSTVAGLTGWAAWDTAWPTQLSGFPFFSTMCIHTLHSRGQCAVLPDFSSVK